MELAIVAVLGCARSGSTILEGKLQQAADITALGEVTYLWSRGVLKDELCGCGARFSRCEFWNAVLEEAVGAVTPSDARRYDAAFRSARGEVLDWDTLLGKPVRVDPLFADIARAIYTAAHKVGRGKALLDSSKAARFAASLQAAHVGVILPIHMFRDARPNVYSLMTPKLRPQSQDGSKAKMASSKTVFHAIAHWKLRNQSAKTLVSQHSTRSATVSYELFCLRPDEQLEALIATLALAKRSSISAENWHSVSGNPMRFGSDRLDVRQDERWKLGLTKVQQRIITLSTQRQQEALAVLSLRSVVEPARDAAAARQRSSETAAS